METVNGKVSASRPAGQLRRYLLSTVLLVAAASTPGVAFTQTAKPAPETGQHSESDRVGEKAGESAEDIAQPGPLYAEPTRPDRTGRVLAKVEINGQGPFRFIVDTGANRSALAPGVVERLALPLVAGESIEVHGVTGSAMLPVAEVASLRAGDLLLPSAMLPVLSGDIFGGADGFLGVAGLGQMRLDVDFVHDRVAIGPSNGRHAPSDYVTVRGQLWHGGLLLVNGRVGSIPVKVIVDTGAERTMGNLSLRAKILAKTGDDEGREATVHGATPDVDEGTYFVAPTIWIGPARLTHLPVTFANLHVFDLWGLTDEPALVVGMDVLGTLDRFIVDYKRQEFQMLAHGESEAVIRRCTASTCGSRIPEEH
jgi:predicted aspartyl protease